MTPCTCQKWRDQSFRSDINLCVVSSTGGWRYCPWCSASLTAPEKLREEPAGMTQRSLQAENAFFRDISKKREEYEIVMAAKDQIPDGCHLVECYETEKNYVVIGNPEPNDEAHNCDFMGCSTLSHVIARFPKRPIPTQPEE